MNVRLRNNKSILYLVTTDAYFLSHRLPLARAARDSGFKVLVATTKTLKSDSITQEGFTFIPLKKLKRTGQNPLEDLRALLEIIQIYRGHKPDIVHHVALKPVLYGSLAAWFTRVPRVINALTGLGYLFISTRWTSRFLKSMVMGFFRALFNRSNHTLILQNKDDFKKFAEFVRPQNLALIRGSGVDTKHFCPSPKKTNNHPLKVALVARMLFDKGVQEAVDAVTLLKKHGTPITLLLAGMPDLENPRSICEQKLNEWHKSGDAQWIGHQDDVAKLYQTVDVALLPSYREGLPKSLLEAASCGLPIIASDVPGCREVVKDGDNGFLVPLTPKGIAEALQKMAEDQALRHRMGKKSRLMALAEFSKERISEETLALYSLPNTI